MGRTPHLRFDSRFARMPHFTDIAYSAVNHGRDLIAHTPAILKRSPAASTSTCTSGPQSDTCEKPTNTSTVLPIALGVAIPLTVAIVVLLVLHRRNRKRQILEDRNDAEKYRSLDFGMDLTFTDGRKRKKGQPSPQMAQTEEAMSRRQMKGLSIDAGPFIFAGNAQDSAASIHSLSRSAFDPDSRYRLADDASIRSFTPTHRGRTDTDSTFDATSSIRKQDLSRPGSAHANLLRHPQPPAKSIPPRGDGLSPLPSENKEILGVLLPTKPANTLALPSAEGTRESYLDNGVRDFRKSNNYLKDFINVSEDSQDEEPAKPSSKADSAGSTLINSPLSESPKAQEANLTSTSATDQAPPAFDTFVTMEEKPLPQPVIAPVLQQRTSRQESVPPPTRSPPPEQAMSAMTRGLPSNPRPPRKESMEAGPHHSYSTSVVSETSNYDNYSAMPRDSSSTLQSLPPRGQSLGQPMPVLNEYTTEHLPVPPEAEDPDFDSRRLSVFMRPTPPEDPSETPEVRANRIRSFYKEYFDKNDHPFQSSSVPAEYQLQPGDYYEDYDQEYLNAATVFDAASGTFVVAGAPYTQPVTRRAMTPPPRAPPRFKGMPGSAPGSRAGSRPGSRSASRGSPPMYQRSRAASSTGRYDLPPRGQSAMSAPRGRTPYKKPLPPPSPLVSLPTPHLLKDDTIFNATIDFAPPTSFRDRQAGRRPDSPLGTPRPFSPTVRPFTPLASSFEDLNSIPSPHLLRKSGVYTSLDFAPPKRFRNDDTASDAGSIRSGRSGMSAHHMYNIRNGAYRVSKLPKELAGTRDDLNTTLRPTWDMRGPA